MGEKFTIGVMIGNANSPYMMDLMQGIHDAAKAYQVNVIFFLGIHSTAFYRMYFGGESPEDYDYQTTIVYDYALLTKVDALIVAYGALSAFLEDKDPANFLKKFAGIPYVLLEENDKTGKGSSIVGDDYCGMYQLVEHLVKGHGYRNFTYLSGPRDTADADRRRRAFHDVMEKYHLPHEESRVEYGDFSACVEKEVIRLLEDYPHMEAMVCANDLMANTAYRVFAQRGIEVGRDVAVTGYDDWQQSKIMNPPLTTVAQNIRGMGYMALTQAVALCEGKAPRRMVMPVKMKLRESCGCLKLGRKNFHLEEGSGDYRNVNYLNRLSDVFVERISTGNYDARIREEIRKYIWEILRPDYGNPVNATLILSKLKNFLNQDVVKYISLHELKETFEAYLDERMEVLLSQKGRVTHLVCLKAQIQDIITSRTIKYASETHMLYQQETWFLPLISRDMIAKMEDEKEFYAAAMQKLFALKHRSTFLYIFEKPIRHRVGEEWSCPEKMYLAACQSGGKILSFQREERPLLTAESGLAAFCSGEVPYGMYVFCLFSEEVQYGILVTEIEPDSIPLSYLISMQIANALGFYELYIEQRRTQNRLEELVREINEKNEVLNFISEYDVLTGCLNRRGFVERFMQFNRDHTGENAMLIFADLDHLKEINDCFGHSEGDFALRSAASLLQELIGQRGILGRLGGDEFVALLTCEASDAPGRLEDVARERIRLFNENSGKPYFVETTMGTKLFTCEGDISLAHILDEADKQLYEAKGGRRKTVFKNGAGGDKK